MTNVPVGLLIRARIAAELSNQVYATDKVRSSLKEACALSIETCFTPAGVESVNAVPLYCTPKKAKVQYAIWEVAQVGFLVAFRGTHSVFDWVTDANILPERVRSSAWSVHRGILKAFEDGHVYAEVLAQYSKWCKQTRGTRLPLILTGHSLGGGYAVCFALRYLAEALLQAELDLRVLTFGAPLVLADRSVVEELATVCKEKHGRKFNIHNFVSLYDMVPRVLGQYLPDSVRRQVPYVDSRVSCVAEDFTPFGHFHVLGQKHMRTTLMHSNGSTEDSHVLRLNHHEETILAPLITANSLKGVLLLGHDMTGYIKEVTAILECCSACSFERGGAEYQATLCHQGEESISQQGWLSEDAMLAWTHTSGLVLSSAPREQESRPAPTGLQLIAGFAEAGLRHVQHKVATFIDPLGHQSVQIGLETLCQTTSILKTVNKLEVDLNRNCVIIGNAIARTFHEVQHEGALVRQAVTDVLERHQDQISKAFDDQKKMLNLIQIEQKHQADSIALAIQLIAQADSNNQYRYEESKRVKLEKKIAWVFEKLQELQQAVQNPGASRPQGLPDSAATNLKDASQRLRVHARAELNACKLASPDLAQEQKVLLLLQRHNLAMAIATASVGIESAVYVEKSETTGHSEAINCLKEEIVTLLQHATVYSLTAMLRDVLQRYVFMLRGLMHSTRASTYLCTPSDKLPKPPVSTIVKHAPPGCFGRLSKANCQVDSAHKAPALPATAQLVHEMTTLQPWQDGLEELLPLLAPTDCSQEGDSIAAGPMPDSLELLTFADWEWYMELVQLPPDTVMQKQAPPTHVPISVLLERLGVGPTMMPIIQQRLRLEHMPLLREAVLPRFIDEVIACIDEQVPGLGLSGKHAQTPLLHGMAQGVLASGSLQLLALHRDDSLIQVSTNLRVQIAACQEKAVQEGHAQLKDMQAKYEESEQSVSLLNELSNELKANLSNATRECEVRNNKLVKVQQENADLKWKYRSVFTKIFG